MQILFLQQCWTYQEKLTTYCYIFSQWYSKDMVTCLQVDMSSQFPSRPRSLYLKLRLDNTVFRTTDEVLDDTRSSFQYFSKLLYDGINWERKEPVMCSVLTREWRPNIPRSSITRWINLPDDDYQPGQRRYPRISVTTVPFSVLETVTDPEDDFTCAGTCISYRIWRKYPLLCDLWIFYPNMTTCHLCALTIPCKRFNRISESNVTTRTRWSALRWELLNVRPVHWPIKEICTRIYVCTPICYVNRGQRSCQIWTANHQSSTASIIDLRIFWILKFAPKCSYSLDVAHFDELNG